MNRPIDFDSVRHQLALNAWLDDCRMRMSQRYPKLNFDADVWDLRALHGADLERANLVKDTATFQGKDRTFDDARRCLIAELMLDGVKTAGTHAMNSFHLLGFTSKSSIFDLDLAELRKLEEHCLAVVRDRPSSSTHIKADLDRLERQLGTLYKKGVLPFLNYHVQHDTKQELGTISNVYRTQWRKNKADILDHQIEALSEGWNALADNDTRLTPAHRTALAGMGLELCAPSRINEVLCMSIDDFATIEQYAREGRDSSSPDQNFPAYSAHQMLIITMKGSKGAEWSPKPVLSFMMQFFHYCMDLIKENGKRSRMLVKWYQTNPGKLYLPPELERLRGQDLSVEDMDRIMRLGGAPITLAGRREKYTSAARKVFSSRQHAVTKLRVGSSGKGAGNMKQMLPWHEAEAGLLEMVRKAMAMCRRVTGSNHYQGDLAKMLFLFDYTENRLPFLPGAFNKDLFGAALKRWHKSKSMPRGLPTVFETLDITMPVKGQVQRAYIEPHDPRRWLTTMAEIYGSKLSDVLINKWANRLILAQLWNYDFEPLRSKAAKSAMPDSPSLEGLSKEDIKMRPREDVCGLQQKFVEVHDIGVSVVSMNAIYNSSKNRPRAKTAEDLVVLYANWFGCCPHKHHSVPCKAYSSCVPCDTLTVVKGHVPTNDHIRERNSVVYGSILYELERLVDATKYEIADDQIAVDAHIMGLVRQGLNPKQMADHLIAHFHEIKDQIADVVFRNMLEEAFVATGYVALVDDPERPSGANFRYNNPSRHAAPGLELGMQAHGGPEIIQQRIEDFAVKYPQFAPQSPEELNQRLLPSPDDEIDGERDDGDSEEVGDE